MNNELPIRKSIRLPNFDYTQAGYYFVTICTKDKAHILWDMHSVGAAICRPQDDVMLRLTDIGNIVEQVLSDIPNHYQEVRVDKYVIMPNHVHVIIVIGSPNKNGRQFAAPTPSLSDIIGQMKRVCSKRAGIALWQKGYYDHIIRNEKDYLRIWQYIDDNPIKWTEDEYYCE